MDLNLLYEQLLAVDPRWLMAAAAALGLFIGLIATLLATRPGRLRRDRELRALRSEVKTEAALAEERARALEQAEQRLAATFGKLANESLAQQSESMLRLARESLGRQQDRARAELGEREQAIEQMIRPIREALNKTHEQIRSIEKARHESFGSIRTQLEGMSSAQDKLRDETHKLVKALRRPEVRGQWGELTLRRLVELAGMVEHCDFNEQAQVAGPDGNLRPDLVVHLPERGTIVVDVKTPLDAYLEAVEAEDDASRQAALMRHARKVAERVRELSGKTYWAQFERSPEFVILFIPGDQFLTAALNEAPNLLEDAMRQRVILATPSSLVALLKAVAFGWRQLTLADNAEVIRRLAEDLYGRLVTFTGHVARVGKQLEGSVNAYNQAVGSLERMVLPGARKFTELGVQAKTEIPAVAGLETTPRKTENPDAETDKNAGELGVRDDEQAEPSDPAKPH